MQARSLRNPPPVAEVAPPVAHPAQRFILRSIDGQTLHENERVLTRLSSFFWRGTADQVAKLRRGNPQWLALTPMEVT